MRIAIVFTSPNPSTKEYQNVWNSCPQKKEIAHDQLVIEGTDWKLFTFDGQSRRYYDGTWNLETIKDEVSDVFEKYAGSNIGILLHGTDAELNILIEQLKLANPLEIYYKWYTSSKGNFFNKYIKQFSSEASDECFENLWTKLAKGKLEIEGWPSLAEEVSFLRHRLSNILTFMKLKVNTAQKNKDKGPLLEFIKFNMDDFLKKYSTIEDELVKQEIKGTRDLRIMIEEVIGFIVNIKNPEIPLEHALNLGNKCLNKTRSVYQVFLELKGVIHG